jgi:tetratricopeptide (TPR) repeat protein
MLDHARALCFAQVTGEVMKHTLTLFATVLTLALASCTSGADRAKRIGSIQVDLTGGPSTQAEADDGALLLEARNAFNARGYPALQSYLPRLRVALDRAPASYPITEKRPNGSYVVRASDKEDGMMLLLITGALGGDSSGNSSVAQTPNVYGGIALILGSDAVERKAFADAHGYLDRGLALQPANWELLAEKSAAFLGQNNWREALALADKTLDSDDMIIGMHRDDFLRKRGFVLVELGRLIEAREAYVEALKANKDDKISQSEITYIDGLLNGGKPQGSVMVTPGGKQ